LKPGELFASKNPYKVKTLLGTCVSIVLYDQALKIGGLNHFMLPNGKPDRELPAKYATQAFSILLKKMEELGSRKSTLKAKVFGGSDNTTFFSKTSFIGQRNVETAIQLLEEAKIPVVAQNTGGNKGRKLLLVTSTGNVYMKFLQSSAKLL
jgi:chemotaxis protein CheD